MSTSAPYVGDDFPTERQQRWTATGLRRRASRGVRDERRPVRPARRRRDAGPSGGRLGGRRRRRRRPRDREGGRRRHRRHGGHAAVRARPGRGTRAADHQADRGRFAAQQDALHPARRAAAQPVPALAAHADPHARRRLPVLRGDGEDLGCAPRARRPRRRERGQDRGRGGLGCGPHGPDPVGGDHGDLAQRGGGRRVLEPAGDPRGGRPGDHRGGLRRRRPDREDGRRGAPPRRAVHRVRRPGRTGAWWPRCRWCCR